MRAMEQFSADLEPWLGVTVERRLDGGARSEVYLGSRRGERLVVRRSTRSAASLNWELDLLEHLAAEGLRVPRVLPADDGRRHVEGVVVQEFIRGAPPTTARDWSLVVDALELVHASTPGWPQRPGFASSRDLLSRSRGGDVQLDVMPGDAVRLVRAAWEQVHIGPEGAVHGDPGSGNVVIDDDRVALLDWDEARVDVPWFDFAFVPVPAPLPQGLDREAVMTAGIAWEAATCWVVEPGYAESRHRELRSRA